MAYKPDQLSFDAVWNDDLEMTEVLIHVMAEGEEDMELRLADIDGLPDYFSEADAENYFMVETALETVMADMQAAGFIYTKLTGHGTED